MGSSRKNKWVKTYLIAWGLYQLKSFSRVYPGEIDFITTTAP